MHRMTQLFVAASIALAALLVAPAVAGAQASSAATPTADTSEATYEVQVWPEGDPGITVLIVGVRLPETTQLPATVRIPLPDEAQVFWAGETFGGSIEDDLPRPFSIVAGEGGSSVELTLEETLTAQYDAYYRAMNIDRGDFSVTVDWVQTEPAAAVSFAVRIPTATENVTIEPDPPGSPQENLMGERLYTLTPISVGLGDTTQVEVAYSRPELGGGTQEFPIIPVLGGALVLAVVVLLIAVLRQGRRQADDVEE